MIDWIAFEGACQTHKPLQGGYVVSFDQDGAVEWSVNKRLEVEGSGSSRVQLRSVNPESYEFSGNVTRFFQGHNLWGTNDLGALVDAWDRYAFSRGFPILTGDVKLRRVDVNASFKFDTQAEALEWLRWAAQSAHLSHRGRGTMFKEGTVYWGQGSRRSSLKAYSKHLEVVSTKRVAEGSPAFEVTKGLIRVEATVRGLELERMGLRNVTEWIPETAKMVLMSMVERLSIPENAPADSLLDELPRRLHGPYAQWLHGRDPRAVYPRRTAYRYRKELLEFGVDIFIPPAEPSKVGQHQPVERKGWDIRKLKEWQPSAEDIAALGWFEPSQYRPAPYQSRGQA